MISIEYSNTIPDMVAVQKVALRHSSISQKLMVQRWYMIEALLGFICLMFAINHSPVVVFLVFVGLSGVAWILRKRAVIVQFRRDLKRESKKDSTRSFSHPKTLEVTENGVSIVVAGLSTDFDWSKIVYAGADDRYLYLITTSVLHYGVPRTAASDETTWQALVSAVETGFAKAKKDLPESAE